ncbi:MAG: CxxC-x17-CxxC domain-containing protein [Candidatus Thermoplasmatota archaeon]
MSRAARGDDRLYSTPSTRTSRCVSKMYGGNRGPPSGPREMFDVTCGDCGQATQVPFKPTEGRPVYCRECFAKHRPPRDSFGGGGGGARRY